MEIKATLENGIQYVVLSGRLDAVVSDEIMSKLTAMVDEGHTKMVVCMEHIDYISSSGLRSFLAVGKKIGSAGFLRFCCMQASVKEVFTITGFHTIFQIFNTKDEAFA
jgi:anti-anti-sigma factor